MNTKNENANNDSQLDKPLNKQGEEITENDITPEELNLLDSTDGHSGDDDDGSLNRAELDNIDEEGEPLNETNNLSGNDLDVPGADADDDDEEIGEEDEENNDYSNANEEED
jgi:hypothetical protein